MLIRAENQSYPDHPTKWPDDRINLRACRFSWWFRCDHTAIRLAGKTKVKEQCPQRWYISCAGGAHIDLDLAFAALAQQGWTLLRDGSGLRCPRHSS